MAGRLGRPCLFLPSARLAIYVALRARVRPGGRVLMSPNTDDVIFFIVLAAGFRPAMAPLSAATGNIDVEAVPEEVWTTIDAVLTTNLYGIPDDVAALRERCDRHGIALIEDAAHAIHAVVGGSPIGTFGDLAAFSFSKQAGAPCGGVLAYSDEAARADLRGLAEAEVVSAGPGQQLIAAGRFAAERLIVRLGLVWPARLARRGLGLAERSGFRMALRPADLRRAIAVAPALAPFDSWVRTDRHDYRVRPSRLHLDWILRRLGMLEQDRQRRMQGVERLRAFAPVPPAVQAGDPQPLFRVPLLVEDRATTIRRLERLVHGVGYIYDPPLDDYAGGEFADPSAAPAAARDWAARVMPVDPLEAEAVLKAI